MKIFRFLAVVLALAVPGFCALNAVESARVHTATGAFGGTVSGATVATPSVITTSAAHNLVSGDQVQITGVGGTTTVNTLAYAKVLSPTTFSIFSDSALATGITGTGSYTSGGAVSMAYDVSASTAPWTLRIRVESLTNAKKILLHIQDSADGFASDINTLAVVNLTGTSPVGCTGLACGPAIEYTIRGDYMLPSARVGLTNGRLRLKVQAIDSSASATVSWFFEQ